MINKLDNIMEFCIVELSKQCNLAAESRLTYNQFNFNYAAVICVNNLVPV